MTLQSMDTRCLSQILQFVFSKASECACGLVAPIGQMIQAIRMTAVSAELLLRQVMHTYLTTSQQPLQ